jgi:hypothetical protein
MKTLLITFFAVVSTAFSQDVEKMTATFDHYDDYVYYFKDSEGQVVQFEQKDDKVWEKYDLITGDYEGKKFEITYTVEIEEDEDGEEIYTSTILDLKLLD